MLRIVRCLAGSTSTSAFRRPEAGVRFLATPRARPSARKYELAATLRRNASTDTRVNKDVAVNLRDTLSSVERNLENIAEYTDSDRISREIRETQASLEDPQLWMTNPGQAAKLQSRLSDMQHQLATHDRLRKSLQHLKELSALGEATGDSDFQSAVLLELKGLLHSAEEHLISLWLSDPVDQNSAYIDIRAGSGGTEACDWASMLARMYTKWAHSKHYAVRTVDETPGDVAGIKATTLLVEGRYAYGYAQYESGVHRLVRISPFDKAGARHTSFASVRVSPYIDDDGSVAAIELKPADLQITTMRSQGAGGQHVNKTESAVRVVHIPTGITVACQQERSQHQNRTLALSLLRAKLYDVELQKRAQSAADAHNALPENSWGSQIRSYTLQPYQLVKDLRTGYEVASNAVQDVLDGDLNGLMEASLRKFKKKA